MTARTKVTLVEASKIKSYLVEVVVRAGGQEVRYEAPKIVDHLFAEGIIDVDATLAKASARTESEPT